MEKEKEKNETESKSNEVKTEFDKLSKVQKDVVMSELNKNQKTSEVKNEN